MNEITNPLKAIRAKCYDCCGDNMTEVRLCPSTKCALYAFRMGKNPYRTKRVLTEEQKQAMLQRLHPSDSL